MSVKNRRINELNLKKVLLIVKGHFKEMVLLVLIVILIIFSLIIILIDR